MAGGRQIDVRLRPGAEAKLALSPTSAPPEKIKRQIIWTLLAAIRFRHHTVTVRLAEFRSMASPGRWAARSAQALGKSDRCRERGAVRNSARRPHPWSTSTVLRSRRDRRQCAAIPASARAAVSRSSSSLRSNTRARKCRTHVRGSPHRSGDRSVVLPAVPSPTEQLLHGQQITVSKHRVQRRQSCVGAQNVDPVEAGVVGDLPVSISKVLLVRGRSQITSIGGVADQGLVARRSCRSQRGDDPACASAASVPPRPRCGRRCNGVTELDLLDRNWVSLAARALDAERRERPRRSSTTSRTSSVLRSRTPRMYSSPRSSRATMVGAEIMPRSATTQTRPIAKRLRNRSITGIRTATSAVLPGHISEQIGRPSASITTPTIICISSGR